MSRFDRLNIRVIRTITVLVVMCVVGVFFPVPFAIGESPVTPLSAAPASGGPRLDPRLDRGTLHLHLAGTPALPD